MASSGQANSADAMRKVEASSLVADYAAIATLVKRLEQQVTTFVCNAEKVAHNAAPAYDNLTHRWMLEAESTSSGDAPPGDGDQKPAAARDSTIADVPAAKDDPVFL